MKKIQTELLAITKSISEIASKIDSLAQELEVASPKKAPAKKTKAPAKKTKTIKKLWILRRRFMPFLLLSLRSLLSLIMARSLRKNQLSQQDAVILG